MPSRVAALDVGTNTTRLLVAESYGSGYRDLDRRLIFTRLGEGVDSMGRISKAAGDRTLRAVAEFLATAGEFGVQRLRIAGTSALRDASNREELLDQIRKLAAVEPEVLSGPEEARLSFLGATHGMGPGLYLVCDIGGGSTEFLVGEPGDAPEGWASIDVGSVRLTERFLRSDPPGIEEMLLMEAAIDDALQEPDQQMPRAGEAQLIGVAGTVTSLGALYLGLDDYEPTLTHGLRLTRHAIERLYRRLAGQTVEERLGSPALPPGRADVIVAGAALVVRVMKKWGFEELLVSERDILDGLVLDMLAVPEESQGQ